MTGFAVRLDEVSKRYRPAPGQVVTALDRVSLSVEAGSVVALVGPSGSGKSTLLHLVGAMDTADEGRIRVGERELTELSRRDQTAYRRTIGFVFQRFHLLPALTVADNVAAPLLPRRGAADVVPRARALLDAVGLDGKGDVLPSRLSAGAPQRPGPRARRRAYGQPRLRDGRRDRRPAPAPARGARHDDPRRDP